MISESFMIHPFMALTSALITGDNITLYDMTNVMDMTLYDMTHVMDMTLCDVTHVMDMTLYDMAHVMDMTLCDVTHVMDMTLCDVTHVMDMTLYDMTHVMDMTLCDVIHVMDMTLYHTMKACHPVTRKANNIIMRWFVENMNSMTDFAGRKLPYMLMRLYSFIGTKRK